MKKYFFGLIGISMLLFGSSSVFAEEDYVYIPNESLRNQITQGIESPLRAPGLPSVNQMIDYSTGQSNIIFHDTNYDNLNKSRSIEGLQFLKEATNVNLLMFNNVIDFRALGEMTKLQYIQIYSAPNAEIINSQVVVPIDYVKNLKQLKKFDGYISATDLTPFNDLKELEGFGIVTSITKGPLIAVSKNSREVIFTNPMQYSIQLNDGDIFFDVEESDDVTNLTDSVYSIRNIPNDTNELTINIYKSKGDFSHTLQYTCPIVWY